MKSILDHGLSTLWELISFGLRFLNYLVQGKQACLDLFGLDLIYFDLYVPARVKTR